MSNRIKKFALIYVCFWMTSCLLPALSWALLTVQTVVVSGNITHVYDDRSVKLDNGKVYQPSRKELVLNLSVGEPVTLRYMVEESKNVFFEFAPGMNSLKEIKTVRPEEDNSPK